MFYNLNDFTRNVVELDFQRTNRFSIIFATNPANNANDILGALGGVGTIFNGAPLGANLFGDNLFGNLLNSSIEYGANKIINQTGIKRLVIGAMNNRLVESILGQFEVGQAIIDFFALNMADKGLWVEAVNQPSHNLDYEMDHSYKSPSIRIKGRTYDPLIIKFRVDSMANNHRAFIEWNHATKDPVTGLVAFAEEVSADIQVNLHDRNGLPHSTTVYKDCIPVAIEEGEELDFETMNMIKTFTVKFAYRTAIAGKVPLEKALEWLASRGIDSVIGNAGLTVIDQEWLHAGQQTFNIFGKY